MNVKIVVVFIVLVAVVLIGSFFVRDLFNDLGIELELENSRTLVSPGHLQHFSSADRGLITVYRRTGQAAISLFDSKGMKQWEKIFASNRQLIDSAGTNIIVGEEHNRKISLLDLNGETLTSWQVTGDPLFCAVSNDGRTFVVSELMADQASWEIQIDLKDQEGKELFSAQYSNKEIVNVSWSPLGVVVLAFSFDRDDPGQYLYFYDNYCRVLYQRRFDEEIRDFSLSPSGHYLIWATKSQVELYNVLLDTLTTFEIADVLGLGFSSENRVFYIQNSFSILPPEKQVIVSEMNLSGQRIGRIRYSGELINYQLLRDGTLLVATNSGVYTSKNLVSLSYLTTNNIQRAFIDRDYIIYVLKEDNRIDWYK